MGAHGEGPARRWRCWCASNEAGNELPPSDFLRAAERYRLKAGGSLVVQTTLAALGRGVIAVQANRSVAINISGQPADLQFLEFVVECLTAPDAARAGVLRSPRTP